MVEHGFVYRVQNGQNRQPIPNLARLRVRTLNRNLLPVVHDATNYALLPPVQVCKRSVTEVVVLTKRGGYRKLDGVS